MSVPVLLPTEFQERLTCSSCRHILSVDPITKSPLGYHCGRCPNQSTAEHCTIYETLARCYLFPCKYKIYGCRVYLPFGMKMKQHEGSCEKRSYHCPSGQECFWQGRYNQIEKHFVKAHGELILKNLQVEVDLEANTNKRFAHFCCNTPPIFIDLSCSKDRGLSVELLEMLINENAKSSFSTNYEVTLFSCYSDCKISFPGHMGKFFLDSSMLKAVNNVVINTNDLSNMSKVDKKLIIAFNVKLAAAPPPKDTFVCPINDNYYSACKNRVYGCTFMALYLVTQIHESTCFAYKCPLAPDMCEWRGLMGSFTAHCQEKHKVAEGPLMVNFQKMKSSEKTTYFYLLHSEVKPNYIQTFRVCVELKENFGNIFVRTAVQYVGEAHRAAQYIYHVTFHDGIISNTKTFDCLPFTCGKETLKYGICFQWDKIENCIALFDVKSK